MWHIRAGACHGAGRGEGSGLVCDLYPQQPHQSRGVAWGDVRRRQHHFRQALPMCMPSAADESDTQHVCLVHMICSCPPCSVHRRSPKNAGADSSSDCQARLSYALVLPAPGTTAYLVSPMSWPCIPHLCCDTSSVCLVLRCMPPAEGFLECRAAQSPQEHSASVRERCAVAVAAKGDEFIRQQVSTKRGPPQHARTVNREAPTQQLRSQVNGLNVATLC